MELTSSRRAWLAPSAIIGIVGLALTGIGLYVSRAPGGDDSQLTRYQGEVLAVCARIQGLPTLARDLTSDERGHYSKAALLEIVNTNAAGTVRELELLDEAPVPKPLRDAKRRFMEAKADYIEWGNKTIHRAEAELPPTFTSDRLASFVAGIAPEIVQASTEIGRAMTALAGSDCRLT